VPHLDLNLAPTAEDMPEMAIALIRAIIAAADKDRDEMTVLLIHGTPAAVIAPYGHERRPGAAVEIRFDQTAPPEARLVLTDVWGGEHPHEHRGVPAARPGRGLQPLRDDGADRGIVVVNAPAQIRTVNAAPAELDAVMASLTAKTVTSWLAHRSGRPARWSRCGRHQKAWRQ
jgi:hypothetical protein